MKAEKGIKFKYTSEADAENYLANINNYLRTAAYRKNYQKHTKGINSGKYICLDFSYLQELSIIDMHFRFIVSKMCLDIEHDLTHKYFTIQHIYNAVKKKTENKIAAYDACPAWVLLEMLTFGDFIKFYEFYYSSRHFTKLSTPIINLVKSLRNGAAHNNCILADLAHGTSRAPSEISQAISKIGSINSNQRQKKLSCRPMLEFTCLIYVYKLVVSDKVKYHRIRELKDLFFKRMPEKKGFFKNNDLIKSNYEFACKVISAFFQQA